MDELVEKLKDLELRHLWHSTNSLHQNFYEGWMTLKSATAALKDVERFVERLKELPQYEGLHFSFRNV